MNDGEKLGIVLISLALIFSMSSVYSNMALEKPADEDQENNNHWSLSMSGFFCCFALMFSLLGTLSLKSSINREGRPLEDGFVAERILGYRAPEEPTLDDVCKTMDGMKKGKGL